MSVADMLNTYSTIGNREDLSDQVADLFADDSPAFALARKVKASGTKHEWTADTLGSVVKTAVIEGASVSYTKPGVRTRHFNYTMIRLRNWEVTHTQQSVDTAGVKDSVKRELMKAMKNIVRDYDAILLNTANSAVGTTATGRTSRGIQNAIKGAGVATAIGTGTGNSATVSLKEANVNSVMQKIWNNGGNPKVLFCGGYQKRVISQNFSAKTGFSWNIDQSTRKAINNINSYEGSFGTLEIVPDRQHLAKRVTIVDPEMFRLAVLRDIETFTGAKTSSSIKGWVEAEMCLEWGNKLGHGRISYLKTSGVL